MDARTIKDAKANLEQLMDAAVENHMPVIITRDGKQACVLVSLEDWNSEEATNFLKRSAANQARLTRSIKDADAGRFAKTMTVDEFEQMAAKPRAKRRK
jgi:antitoxin YefM